MTRRVGLILAWGILLLTVIDAGYLVAFSSYSKNEYSNNDNKSNYNQESLDGPVLSILIEVFDATERFIERHEKLLIVISTAAIAAFTYTLWRATTGLFRLAKRQSDDMRESLRIAGESANAAIKSADAADRTVKIMETNAERQLRAYVYAEVSKFVWKNGTPKIFFKIVNHGQTPARKCSFRAAFRIFETGGTFPGVLENVDPNAYPSSSRSDLPVKISFVSDATLDHQLTTDEIAALESDKLAFCFFGMIRYKDVFEREDRWTKFRFMSHKGMGLDEDHMYACQDGNDAT